MSIMAYYGDGKDEIFVTWFEGVILEEDLCEKKKESTKSEAVNWQKTGDILPIN